MISYLQVGYYGGCWMGEADRYRQFSRIGVSYGVDLTMNDTSIQLAL